VRRWEAIRALARAFRVAVIPESWCDASGVLVPLVSLVSVLGRNWCYLCGTVERVDKGEIVEIANIDAVFMHVAEKMVGY
jgi:hypothetical protein